jgi:heptose I phosphotransferase
MNLYLREELAAAWAGRDPFAMARAQGGEIYRDKEGRRTLRFELNRRAYFLKLHQGVGWREIIKNLLQLRLPVLGAANEYHAIRALQRLGVDTLTVAGFGRRGGNPATQLSFLITDELSGVQSLEDYCRDWRLRPPAPALKRRLIERLADISRTLHEHGINHRDYYLCHFMLDLSQPLDAERIRTAPLHLIDLHRAQLRRRVPRRWRIKDLGALYYSALELGLGARDVLRFIRRYRRRPLTTIFADEPSLWRAVRRRAGAIYRRDFGRDPQWPL